MRPVLPSPCDKIPRGNIRRFWAAIAAGVLVGLALIWRCAPLLNTADWRGWVIFMAGVAIITTGWNMAGKRWLNHGDAEEAHDERHR